MRLSYDNLLLHLAHDYNNVLLHHTPSRSKQQHKHRSLFIERKKRKRMEQQKEEELQEIEDFIVVVLSLRSKRRRLNESVRTSRQSRKGWKYEKNDLYFTDPETCIRSKMTYRHSLWYQNYILNAQPEKKWWRKIFRLRFRLPYGSFLELVDMCQKSPILEQWVDGSCKRYNAKQGASIELLVLCVLRYLGRAWSICDLSENVVINKETIRLFINKFVEFGSTELFQRFVVEPEDLDQLFDCNKEFALAGLPGCIGSTDATHVVTERCIYALRQLHLGYKKEHTARTYNLTVNH